MTEEKRGKKPRQSSNKGRYELSAIDLRFLKVVDTVIEKNRNANMKLNSDNSISKTVFGDRNIISKVRASQRGISMSQLEKFAIYFNLDFNCFFRDTDNIQYNTEDIGGHVLAKDKGIASTGKNAIITQVEGDHNGDIIGKMKGNVYKGSKIGQVIQKAEKIINNNLDDEETKQKCEEIMDSIEKEAKGLESTVIQQNEDIKKMAEIFEAQLRKVEEERDEAREGERKIMKKYLSLVEKKS